MFKKLMLACMAIAAFAALTASSASAFPVVTHPTGTLMPVGKGCPESCILATNVGETVMKIPSTGQEIRCSVAQMTGELHVNKTTENTTANIVAAKFENAGGADCTGPGSSITKVTIPATNLPWCVKGLLLDKFEIRGGSCTATPAPITFILDVTNLANCAYSKEGIEGNIQTDINAGEDAVLSINEVEVAKEAGQSILCPSPGKLTMSFTLETDNANKAEPVYFSS